MNKLNQARALAGKGPRIPEHIAVEINYYLLKTAAALLLGDWMIVLNDDPPRNESATAVMNSRRGQKYAGVWLSDKYLDPDCDDLDDVLRSQTLIHEVLHLHFEEPWHLFEDVTDNELVKSTAEAVQHVFRNQMEVAIDQLAWVFQSALPMLTITHMLGGKNDNDGTEAPLVS